MYTYVYMYTYWYTYMPMFKAIRVNTHAAFTALCTMCSTFTLDVSVPRMSKLIGHQWLVLSYQSIYCLHIHVHVIPIAIV